MRCLRATKPSSSAALCSNKLRKSSSSTSTVRGVFAAGSRTEGAGVDAAVVLVAGAVCEDALLPFCCGVGAFEDFEDFDGEDTAVASVFDGVDFVLEAESVVAGLEAGALAGCFAADEGDKISGLPACAMII